MVPPSDEPSGHGPDDSHSRQPTRGRAAQKGTSRTMPPPVLFGFVFDAGGAWGLGSAFALVGGSSRGSGAAARGGGSAARSGPLSAALGAAPADASGAALGAAELGTVDAAAP